MKQSIVALIRPNLNLSQRESQAAHLIEHLLCAPRRLKAMGISDEYFAQNIIANGGQVNDFYLTEYFVVRSGAEKKTAQLLKQHQKELHSDSKDFIRVKSALIEELNENRGEFIDMAEQFSKAIYLSESPTIRNAWNDLKSIANLSYDETIKIFHKYNIDNSLLCLSFDNFKIDRLPTVEKNRLTIPKTEIELSHPWQPPSSLETTYLVALPPKVDYLISILYRRSLTGLRFGLLYDELRHKRGLVYDIDTDLDYDNNSLSIYFSSSEKNSDKVTKQIKKSLENYDLYIQRNLINIKKRYSLDIELIWGDVQTQYLGIIETVISGGYTESPTSLIKRLDRISAQDLIKFNHWFLSSLSNEVVSVKHRHGKKLTTKKR